MLRKEEGFGRFGRLETDRQLRGFLRDLIMICTPTTSPHIPQIESTYVSP